MRECLLSRRQFTLAGLAICGAKLLAQPVTEPTAVKRLRPWSPGELDIHHIDTGRGNATFLIGPDGTTILVDCGASIDDPEVSAPNRPDGSRAPGEWVARYALRCARAANRSTLDYLIATHIHPDHVGDVKPQQRPAQDSNFILTGVSQVDQLMPATCALCEQLSGMARCTSPERTNCSTSERRFRLPGTTSSAGGVPNLLRSNSGGQWMRVDTGIRESIGVSWSRVSSAR